MSNLAKEYREMIRKEAQEKLAQNHDLIQGFIDYCDRFEINLTQDDFRYITPIGIVVNHPNIANKVCENINLDKEGLYRCEELEAEFERKSIMNGYYYADNFMLMAHPFFRRGFHGVNNFSPSFIDKFWQLEGANLQRYIRLDPDRLRINVDNIGYFERDIWYAPPFDKDIKNIQDDIGKLRPPLDLDKSHISFLFSNCYSFEVSWKTKGTIKSFEAREFKNRDILVDHEGQKYHPSRYIHAEYDLEKDIFRHFDGSMHLYDTDEYLKRRESDFNYDFKNQHQIKAKSVKLFKINGQVSQELWMKLTGHFFSKNYLVMEYFTGQFPERIQEILKKIRNSD